MFNKNLIHKHIFYNYGEVLVMVVTVVVVVVRLDDVTY